jgi:peptidoglycan/LPS O-acetylase OafA/YrhL
LAEIHQTGVARHRFHLLDALRGITALSVFLWHVPQMYNLRGHSQLFMAVDFFFCLSGFIVPFAYERRMENGLPLKDYLIARFLRLYPTFLMGLLVGMVPAIAVFLSWNSPITRPFALLINLLLQLCMLPALAHQYNLNLFPFDFPAWSLFFEAIASVLYGIAASRRLLRTPVVVFLFGVCAAVFLSHAHRLQNIDQGLYLHEFGLGLARVLLSFAAGILVLRVTRRLELSHLTGAAGGMGALVVAALLIAVLVSPLAVFHGLTGNLLIVAVIFPLLVFCGAHCVVPAAWHKPCEWLGIISYPFYLLHTAVTNTLTTRPMYLWVQGHFHLRYEVTLAGFCVSLLLAVCFGSLAGKLQTGLRDAINRMRGTAKPSSVRV